MLSAEMFWGMCLSLSSKGAFMRAKSKPNFGLGSVLIKCVRPELGIAAFTLAEHGRGVFDDTQLALRHDSSLTSETEKGRVMNSALRRNEIRDGH